jgi:hypothetical protein
MNGKSILIFIIITIYIVESYDTRRQRQAELRSGLLYEKDVDKAVIINPDYITFHRVIPLKHIDEAVNLIQTFADRYQEFCTGVKSLTKLPTDEADAESYDDKYKIYTQNWYTRDSEYLCAKRGLIRPEIRSLEDLHTLRILAHDYQIEYIPAGVKWSEANNQYQFDTDDTRAEAIITKTGVYLYTGEIRTYDINQDLKTRMKHTGGLHVYHFGKLETTYLEIEQYGNKKQTKLVCQRQKAVSTEISHDKYLMRIASQLCRRDGRSIRNMADLATKETRLFHNTPETASDEPHKYGNITNTDDKCSQPKCKQCYNITLIANKIRDVIKRIQKTSQEDLEVTTRYVYYKLKGLISMEVFRATLIKPAIRLQSTQDNRITRWIQYMYCINKGRNEPLEINVNLINTTKLQQAYQDAEGDIQDIQVQIQTLIPKERHKRNSLKQVQIADDIAATGATARWFQYHHNVPDYAFYIRNNTRAIADLNINQAEIAKRYKDLTDEMKTIHNATVKHEFAIATLMAEIDLKQACTSLYNAIQFALLKLNGAINAATQQKTSPYVFSQSELSNLAISNRNKNIYLSDKLEDTEANVYRMDGEYLFTFAVPIEDNQRLYRLFHARSIPLFENEKVITTEIDSPYIGISVDTTQYIDLTAEEYQQCTQQPHCTTVSPRNPIDRSARCTAYSYKTKIATCPSIPSTETRPFFATYNNITYYSTPANYTVHLVCPNVNIDYTGEPVTAELQLGGTGTFYLRQSCFVDTPDNRRIEPQHTADKITQLGSATLSEAIQITPISEGYVINRTQSAYRSLNIPDLIYTAPTPMNIKDMIFQTYEPDKMIPHLLRFILILLVATVIAAIVFACSPRARTWVKTCCFCSNPKKWWDEYKGYHVPGFEKAPNFVPRSKQIFTDWRERMGNPFAKTHVYNVQEKAKEYLEACAQEERRKKEEEEERMEWAQVTSTQSTPRGILKRPGSTIMDADVISVYPNIPIPTHSSSPKRRRMDTFHNPNVFVMGHNTAPLP